MILNWLRLHLIRHHATNREKERANCAMRVQTILGDLQRTYGVPKHMLDELGKLEQEFHDL